MSAVVSREDEVARAAWPPPSPAAAAIAPAADDRYKNRYIIAIAVTLAAVLELIDTSIVNVAIPDMMGNLGATLDEIAWVSTGYIIANVIVIPMSGWLSGWFGRRRYLAGSIALFVTASFFCGAATSLWGLVFWRVDPGARRRRAPLHGAGDALRVLPAGGGRHRPGDLRRRRHGRARRIGPTLGGWIVDNYTWPWIFYINVPLGILAFFMVLAYVRDAAHQERADSVDYAGHRPARARASARCSGCSSAASGTTGSTRTSSPRCSSSR